MVADSRARTGVWAAGIQVEAAANPKESSPWLPAPASTGLHADLLAGIQTHVYVYTHASTSRSLTRARLYTRVARRQDHPPFRVRTYSRSCPLPVPTMPGRPRLTCGRVPPLTHFPLQTVTNLALRTLTALIIPVTELYRDPIVSRLFVSSYLSNLSIPRVNARFFFSIPLNKL